MGVINLIKIISAEQNKKIFMIKVWKRVCANCPFKKETTP
jgi:hypothetical protein